MLTHGWNYDLEKQQLSIGDLDLFRKDLQDQTGLTQDLELSISCVLGPLPTSLHVFLAHESQIDLLNDLLEVLQENLQILNIDGRQILTPINTKNLFLPLMCKTLTLRQLVLYNLQLSEITLQNLSALKLPKLQVLKFHHLRSVTVDDKPLWFIWPQIHTLQSDQSYNNYPQLNQLDFSDCALHTPQDTKSLLWFLHQTQNLHSANFARNNLGRQNVSQLLLELSDHKHIHLQELSLAHALEEDEIQQKHLEYIPILQQSITQLVQHNVNLGLLCLQNANPHYCLTPTFTLDYIIKELNPLVQQRTNHQPLIVKLTDDTEDTETPKILLVSLNPDAQITYDNTYKGVPFSQITTEMLFSEHKTARPLYTGLLAKLPNIDGYLPDDNEIYDATSADTRNISISHVIQEEEAEAEKEDSAKASAIHHINVLQEERKHAPSNSALHNTNSLDFLDPNWLSRKH